MTQIVFAVLFLIAATTCYFSWGRNLGIRKSDGNVFRLRGVVTTILSLIGVFFLASTSFFYVGKDNTAALNKVYGSKSLEKGKIIATNGEKGWQANIFPAGFHSGFMITAINKVHNDLPLVNIPAGFYGEIIALDGQPLPEDNVMSAKWEKGQASKMLDAQYFLENGGYKGVQATVLKPGKHRINLALFNIKYGNGKDEVRYDVDGRHLLKNHPNAIDTTVTIVPKGFVGVVRSNIEERQPGECKIIKAKVSTADIHDDETLSAPLVPVGCRGIWKDPLLPSSYFISKRAYHVTLVDTRVQAWEYRGGFTKRYVNLTLENDGSFKQKEVSEKIEYDPAQDADKAVFVKVEGWDVPQEVRAVVQISPENAPIVVAAVGSLKEVEDRILTPKIRSHVRNVLGSTITYMKDGKEFTRPTRVLDLIENRGILEDNVEKLIREEGRRAGIDVKQVLFGEPAIPPELLLARQREQLSTQLREAYKEERKAQTERIQTEKERAKADQQSTLVQATIKDEAATFLANAKEKEGDGEKRRLEKIAQGQRAQSNVLGVDNAMKLAVIKEVLSALERNPEILGNIKLPGTVVMGGNSGLEGFGAVLGKALNEKPVK